MPVGHAAVAAVVQEFRGTDLSLSSIMCNFSYIMNPYKQREPITTALRRALAESLAAGETFLGLENKTGVLRQSLMKFARGETSLRLQQADKLAEHFQLTVRLPKRKGK